MEKTLTIPFDFDLTDNELNALGSVFGKQSIDDVKPLI